MSNLSANELLPTWRGGSHAFPKSDPRLAQLREEMASHWDEGRRPVVEAVLAEHPDLRDSPSLIVHLVCEEVAIRQVVDDPVSLTELINRFPEYQEQWQLLLDCHHLFREPGRDAFPAVGEKVGEFELVQEIGRGAEGRVLLAVQHGLADRLVVVKIVPSGSYEHVSLARLQHPSIVPLYSAHTDYSQSWLVLCMPYLGSVSLAMMLHKLAPVPWEQRTGESIVAILDEEESHPECPKRSSERAMLSQLSYTTSICWIGACLADAIHHAHERDLIHLDIMPSNVLLSAKAQPMLLDFHLSQHPLRPGEAPPEWFGGTPGYLSPEQAPVMAAIRSGDSVPTTLDGRSDIYSLGLLLGEALGVTASPDREKLRSGSLLLSPGLQDILSRCLAPDPDQRYESAAALAEDLRCHMMDKPLRGVPNRSWVEQFQKWHRRNRGKMARRGITLMLLILLSLIIGLYFCGEQSHGLSRSTPVEAVSSGHSGVHLSIMHHPNYQRGQLLMEKECCAEALCAFEKAIALRPDSFRAYFAYGMCTFRLHRAQESVKAFTRCLSLAPPEALAKCYVNQGLAYSFLRQTGSALKDYDQAIRLNPELTSARVNRGALYFLSGEYRMAFRDFQTARDQGEKSEELLFNLALTYQALNERKAALKQIEVLLASNPDYPNAATLKTELLKRQSP